MRLKVVCSGSSGNAYILYNNDTALIIECGVRWKDLKAALDFNLKKVVGCLVSHEHLDHCKGVTDVLHAGVEVWATTRTHGAMRTGENRRARFLYTEGSSIRVGEFEVMAFSIQHDAVDPVGFLIHHPECGTILFATDTYYLKYTFAGLNNIILEANYCKDIVDRRIASGAGNQFVRDRVIASHMSIQQCKETLQANDLTQVNNIVLIHLSDGNSDQHRFQEEVHQLTNKNVVVAVAGVDIPFNKTPF